MLARASARAPTRPYGGVPVTARRRPDALTYRRRRWAAALLAAAVAAGAYGVVGALTGGTPAAPPHRAATAGGHAPAAGHAPGAGTPAAAGAPAAPASPTTTTGPPAPTTTTGPGTLPQTSALPPASSPQFSAEMGALWKGVVTGSVAQAMPAFFPEGAYLQLKAIPDPRTDYENRLVNEYGHDLAAAHALLGAVPAAATLVSVEVPEQYAHWVPPGVCYNSIGYYEVPNARVVYRLDGAVRSFGIASLISWRGQWYVVHLGLVTRPTTTQQGIVDDPATGPGTSAYSPTC